MFNNPSLRFALVAHERGHHSGKTVHNLRFVHCVALRTYYGNAALVPKFVFFLFSLLVLVL